MYNALSGSLVDDDETSGDEELFVDEDYVEDGEEDEDVDVDSLDDYLLAGIGSGDANEPNQVGASSNGHAKEDAATVLTRAMHAMLAQEQQMKLHKQRQQKLEFNSNKRPANNQGNSPKSKSLKSNKKMAPKKDANCKHNFQLRSEADCSNNNNSNITIDDDELLKVLQRCEQLSGGVASPTPSTRSTLATATATAAVVNTPTKSNSKSKSELNKNCRSAKAKANAKAISASQQTAADTDEIVNHLFTGSDEFANSDVNEMLNHLFSGCETNKCIQPPPPLSASAVATCRKMATSNAPANRKLSAMMFKKKLVDAFDIDAPTTSKKAAAIEAARKLAAENDHRPTDGANNQINNNSNNNNINCISIDANANDVEMDDDVDDDDDKVVDDVDDDDVNANTNANGNLNGRKNRPTPLYLPFVANIMPVLEGINNAIGVDNYYTKPTAGQGLRVQCANIAAYRKLVHHFSQENIVSHTYQLASDRGYRFLIRYLHRSTPPSWIRQQLTDLGYTVRFVSVIKKRFTRQPLDLFEVEIVAEPNSANVLNIVCLGGQKVRIEKILRNADAVQCHRCQRFGHTKNYCRRPFVCVKCSGSHASTDCVRSKDDSQPAKCANCMGEHAASYRGCKAFKEACKQKLSNQQGFQQATKLVAELARKSNSNRINNATTAAIIKRHLNKATTTNATKQQQQLLQNQQQQQQQQQQQRQKQQQQQQQRQKPIKAKKKQQQQQQHPKQPLKMNKIMVGSYADALKLGLNVKQPSVWLQQQQQQIQQKRQIQIQSRQLQRQQLQLQPQTMQQLQLQQLLQQQQQQQLCQTLQYPGGRDNVSSIDKKLDQLIGLMLLERKHSKANANANANANTATNNAIATKLDRLIEMMSALTTCLTASSRQQFANETSNI